ncbi:PaaI family thioesterase [Pseudochelatococcus sp. B33]
MLGVFDRSDLLSRSGLDLMSAVRDGSLPHAPIYRELGAVICEIGDGEAVVRARPDERYYNPLGSMHGGYIATLLDMGMGCAAHTKVAAGSSYTTIELKTNFVRAVNRRSGLLRVVGHVVHAGRRIVTVEGRLFDEEERLCAHGVSTCAVFAITAGDPPH